jgi:hypothetical protein
MKVVSTRAIIRPTPISSILLPIDLSEIDVKEEPIDSYHDDKVTALYPLFGWSSSRLTE